LAQIEAGVRELTAEGLSMDDVRGSGASEDTTPGPSEGVPLQVGQLIIDFQRHMATLDGRLLNLTPVEFGTLTHLAREAGRVVSCSTLVKKVQGYDCHEQEARTIMKTHIRHLRQKLELDPSNPEYILNVRGVGYMLVIPLPEAD
jgi:DNA-binding response OmpR family regulator